MIVLLTSILGTLAVASRATSGLQAASDQSKNREARDTAESGVTEIISELNKEKNRKLLVLPTANWSSSQNNPCSGYNANGASITPVPSPTTKVLSLNGGWTSLESGVTTRQYKLDSATATTTARVALTSTVSSNQLQGLEKTLFKLTVSGRVMDKNNNQLSAATITREYEVVPKCCKRSYGRNSTAATIYGEDTRPCMAGLSGGLGIVVGINGGTLNTSNNAFDMTDQNRLPITRVLCANSRGNTACDSGTLKLGSSISVVPTTFSTGFPTYPGTLNTASSLDTRTKSYIRINNSSSPSTVEQCTLSASTLSACTNISVSSGPCEIVSGNAWCRLKDINSQNTTTVFDTTNGKINLYYPQYLNDGASNLISNNGPNYNTLGGSGQISHVRCASWSANTACGTAAVLADIENLNVFIYGTGTFQLKGTSSALAINIFNLYGKTEMNGGGGASPNFIGRIWTNNMSVNGSVSMIVPISAPTQFCPIVFNCPPEAGGSPSTDWVARSITQSSNF